MTGEANTFDGDGTIVVAGKLEAQESKIKLIYTEDGVGYEVLRGLLRQRPTAPATCASRRTARPPATTGTPRPRA
jgi:hypothetical protein